MCHARGKKERKNSQLTTRPQQYLTISTFLIIYALFSLLIRDRLHLSEPPLALLYGVLLGPAALRVLAAPHDDNSGWASLTTDASTQELTRVVLALQCFAVGIELPARWFRQRRHALSAACLLGPVMTCSWAAASLLARLVFGCGVPAALVLGACLAPTDPVLAASVLGDGARFAARVPRRVRHLLAAESACNDGASFPFLYAGLAAFRLTGGGGAAAAREWFLVTVLYQCALGLALGYLVGRFANAALRFSETRGCVSQPSLVVFYLLLALLCVGVGSTLGLDDFLLAFGAGVGFAHDGWFSAKEEEVQGQVSFRNIVDLILNSSVFVYFGSMIPWASFAAPGPSDVLYEHISYGKLFLFLFAVLLLRRIPAVLVFKRFIPDIKTYTEALFAGHFGPMGVGALFLAIEARAQLETGTSIPLPKPETPAGPPYDDRTIAIALIWPVTCFVVLGSTIVHGLSVLVISLASHLGRKDGERAPLLGGYRQGLHGMAHDDDGEGSEEGDGDILRRDGLLGRILS